MHTEKRIYRGSRKHVLDWTDSPSFLVDIQSLVAPVPVGIPEDATVMPRGYAKTTEARLDRHGPKFLKSPSTWANLRDWWLIHKAGANTPNWDIAVSCEIEERPGLLLVEAKANWPELSVEGKSLRPNASDNSRENHDRIGRAIAEACDGWRRIDQRISIDRDSHYQLANRLAFTWKLAQLGLPVVLLYLGFTGDYGIRDAGEPFHDDKDWQSAFKGYTSGTVPFDILDRRLELGNAPVWVISRSRPIIEVSCAGY